MKFSLIKNLRTNEKKTEEEQKNNNSQLKKNVVDPIISLVLKDKRWDDV